MDKKQRYMNLAIIVILVVFMTVRALPKKSVDLDASGGLFSTQLIAQLTTHIQPKGQLLVSQFSRNNSEAENFSIDLIASEESDRGDLWYVIYDAAADKKPYRAYQQTKQLTGQYGALPAVADAFAQIDRLHPLMPELMKTLTGPAVEGATPFLSLRSNYWWDGNLTLEQQTAMDQKGDAEGSTHTVPGAEVSKVTDVRYFTYGDTLTEGAIADAFVDANSFLVYQTEIKDNTQIDHLVAIVNAELSH